METTHVMYNRATQRTIAVNPNNTDDLDDTLPIELLDCVDTTTNEDWLMRDTPLLGKVPIVQIHEARSDSSDFNPPLYSTRYKSDGSSSEFSDVSTTAECGSTFDQEILSAASEKNSNGLPAIFPAASMEFQPLRCSTAVTSNEFAAVALPCPVSDFEIRVDTSEFKSLREKREAVRCTESIEFNPLRCSTGLTDTLPTRPKTPEEFYTCNSSEPNTVQENDTNFVTAFGVSQSSAAVSSSAESAGVSPLAESVGVSPLEEGAGVGSSAESAKSPIVQVSDGPSSQVPVSEDPATNQGANLDDDLSILMQCHLKIRNGRKIISNLHAKPQVEFSLVKDSPAGGLAPVPEAFQTKPTPTDRKSKIPRSTSPNQSNHQKPNQSSQQKPNQGSQQKPNQGSQQKPNQGSQQKPNQGSQQKPNQGSQQKPNQGSQQKPNQGSQQKPNQGSQQKPNQGSQQKPNQGSQQKPNQGSQQKPNQGSQQKPNQGSQLKPNQVNQKPSQDNQKSNQSNHQKPNHVNQQNANQQKPNKSNQQKPNLVNQQIPIQSNQLKPHQRIQKNPSQANQQKANQSNQQPSVTRGINSKPVGEKLNGGEKSYFLTPSAIPTSTKLLGSSDVRKSAPSCGTSQSSLDGWKSPEEENRIQRAVENLASSNIQRIVSALAILDSARSAQLCETLVELHLVDNIFDFLTKMNRSLAHQIACGHATSLLLDLAKYSLSTESTWQNGERIGLLFTLMSIWVSKDDAIFLNCATLLWVLCQDKTRGDVFRSFVTTQSKVFEKISVKLSTKILRPATEVPAMEPSWTNSGGRRTFDNPCSAFSGLTTVLKKLTPRVK